MGVLRYFRQWAGSLSATSENHSYFEEFLGAPPHAWMRENTRLLRVLQLLFAALPAPTVQQLRKRKIYFVPCNGQMSATLTYESNTSVVLLFPEIMRVLESSDPSEALAILAHELGHIVGDHTTRRTPQLQAQLEADAFACSLGFQEEICALLERERSEEGRIRLETIVCGFKLEKSA